jgi:leucyl aminopeptidase (aminopeptidase T)
VVDGAIAGVGVPSDSVVLKIEAGVIVEFSGGSQADELRALLDKADEKAACVAELGIGTNPKAVLSGHPLVDEKVLGTVHIGFGSNAHMGGCQTSNSHLDAVVLEPSLTLDGEMILKAGQPLWPTSWARG